MGWFETIQIQTNGRKLAEPAYLRRLIEAGVNEFFISRTARKTHTTPFRASPAL